MKEANKLKNQMEDQRKQLFLKANEEEDKIIKKLEKRLGLNKSKNKNNYFADDGLDCILFIYKLLFFSNNSYVKHSVAKCSQHLLGHIICEVCVQY